jgi:hypothetical protein
MFSVQGPESPSLRGGHVYYSAGCGVKIGAVRRKRPGRNNPAAATNPAQPAKVTHSGAKLPAPS